MRILFLLSLFSALLFASVGKISSLRGKGTVIRGTDTLQLFTGLKIEEKDVIETQDKSRAQIIFNDGTLITVGKKAQFNINEYLFDEKNYQNSKSDFKFVKGAFKAITGQIGKVAPKRFKISTKSVTIGVRGTTIVGDENQVACTQGEILVSAMGVERVVPEGNMVDTPLGAPPGEIRAYEGGLELDDTGGNKQGDSKKDNDKQNDDQSNEDDKKEESDTQSSEEDQKTDDDTETSTEEPVQELSDATVEDTETTDTTNVETQDLETVTNTVSDVADTISDATESATDVVEEQTQDEVVEETIVTTTTTTIDDKFLTEGSRDGSTPTSPTNVTDIINTVSYDSEPKLSVPIDANLIGIKGTANVNETDYLSFGLWESSDGLTIGSYTEVLTAVAAVTPSKIIDGLISQRSTLSYIGTTTGSITNTSTNVRSFTTGSIDMTIDFGARQISSGQISLGHLSAAILPGGSVSNVGFETSNLSGTNITSGYLKGNFYGANAEAIGGGFTLQTDTEKAMGAFGAAKVNP